MVGFVDVAGGLIVAPEEVPPPAGGGFVGEVAGVES
jgi:hypothetical protein